MVGILIDGSTCGKEDPHPGSTDIRSSVSLLDRLACMLLFDHRPVLRSRLCRFLAPHAALAAVFCVMMGAMSSNAAYSQSVVDTTLTLDRDSVVVVEQWTLLVPENRSDSSSREIPITFLRLPSRAASPSAPIVYLAGGPGGSGIAAARGPRWDLFDRLRAGSDVILLDQRGTGRSDSVPGCDPRIAIPPDSATTRERMTRLYREAMEICLPYWEDQEVDIRGYTTAESAMDVEAVRQAIGAEHVHLLGISYGTHLALATAKSFPGSVGRMVLASPEGLGQTVKRPVFHERFLGRFQSATDRDSTAREVYPDIRQMMRSVLDSIEADPPRLEVQQRNGESFVRTLGRFEAQLMTGYMMGDPGNARYMLDVYRRAENGDYSGFARLLQYSARPNVLLSGMPEAMDLASGVSEERREAVQAEARTAIVGDALNFPMPHLEEAIPGIDLGPTFRYRLASSHPTLILSGTLDGRTFPEAHAEVAATLDQCAVLTIVNAGHNLFFAHSGVVPRIAAFLDGGPVQSDTLIAPSPSFLIQDD